MHALHSTLSISTLRAFPKNPINHLITTLQQIIAAKFAWNEHE